MSEEFDDLRSGYRDRADKVTILREALRSVGVELIYGEHVWPLAEPRTAGPRELPWAAILSALKPFVDSRLTASGDRARSMS